MSYNEVREVGVPNLDHNPPWNPDYYDHEDPQDETTTTAPPEPYITMAELESIYHILLILFYIAIPVSLILLRCITIKNVPKLDVAFLFNAFTAWFWIIWFIIIWGTNLCYWPGQDWWPFGGLQGGSVAFMIIGPLLSLLGAIVFEPALAWSWTCGCTDSKQPLPIQFDSTSEEEFREIIAQIQDTGPTLTAGVAVEYAAITNKGNRTSFWRLAGWEQFPYKSWVNLQQPHPYFHQDELEAGEFRTGDCRVNFSDLEEVFSCPGPLVIKTTLDVLPANDETAEKYQAWTLTTQTQMIAQAAATTTRITQEFTEEMVTVERLFDDHCPNHLIPSLQLPSLVTNQTENMLYSHMMEARDRFFCEKPPWWLNKCIYAIFTCLLFSSLYRVFYWISVKVVKLHFRKSFNTEGNSTYSDHLQFDPNAIKPYKNHIQNFVIKPFS